MFPLFHISLGPNLGRKGEPWSFTHQPLLLWKRRRVNHTNIELASEIVRHQLEDE